MPTILEALSQLDPQNDDHWTANGSPRMDAIEELIGDSSVTRADVTNAAPEFSREVALAAAAAAPEGEPDPAPEGEGEGEPDPAPEGEGEPDPAPEGEGSGDDEPESEPTSEPEAPASEPEIQASREELEAEREKLTKDMLEAQGAQKEAKKIADDLANQVNNLNRKLDMMNKADPNHGTAGIRAYLKQQNINRMARAAGLTKFIKETGVHPKDVAGATDPKAPIDRAMNARKPARGSVRPNRNG
ncbi:hypothetical protein KAR91_64130 [Candidatus Pacearchaeota archaeon]|nr:hypothetical protein [Candidatus Pacearchaeota archaeon]